MKLFRGAPLSVVLAGLVAASGVLLAQQPQDLPRFRASVELTSIDVSVFDDRGRPIADLKPEDFTARVDNGNRRVVSAEWVPLSTPPGIALTPPPESYSSNDNATGGRLIVIVVDQPNIRFGGTLAIRKAMNAFIDRLEPTDRVAVLGIGPGSPSTNFTGDRARMKKAIEGMVGSLHALTGFYQYNVGLVEAMDIQRNIPNTFGTVIDRECRDSVGRPLQGPELDACISEIQREAYEKALQSTVDGRDTISALRSILTALRTIDAPKTMILVSEGFVMGDEQASVLELGSLSAAARTSIYSLKLDDTLMQNAASESRAPIAPMFDRQARSEGMETLSGVARGSLFTITGNGATIFERISSEMSGYYLLGVESGPTDKDGKAHPIRVEVARKGVTVRSRRALLAVPEAAKPKSAREAVVTALSNPLLVSALPLRVATYSLQDPDGKKVQLVIHADVGRDYSTSRVVSLAYVITDDSGRTVDSQTATARLPPVMNGVPSALQFSGGASLAPGDYMLKLAVAEGDRVGTVEHTFRAGVGPAGPLQVSDLMVGGPLMVSLNEQLLQPTVGYSIVFGGVHGYMEAYGPGVGALTAKYEIAANEKSEAILEADVPPRLAGAGDTRAIFTRILPSRQLPPGQYVLRVTLKAGDDAVKVATRTFEVAAPAVLMTSASTPSTLSVRGEVYLPVSEQALSREFNRSDASRAATVRAFRDRVPESSRTAFDKGVRAFSSGSYTEAEQSFKSAITADEESGAAIAYLAATFAAAGHDDAAAGAWQTSLIGDAEIPEIYEWLAGALLRTRDLALARTTLEEAIAKWPADPRFARPMALVYATFGQGDQAVRSLERHIAAHKDDTEALFLGVEWIYQLHSAGAAAHSPAEDVKLARSYADAYAKTKGPQQALVKQWMEFLEKK